MSPGQTTRRPHALERLWIRLDTPGKTLPPAQTREESPSNGARNPTRELHIFQKTFHPANPIAIESEKQRHLFTVLW